MGAVSLGLQRQQATQQQAGKAAQQAARKRHRLAEVHKGPVTVKVLKAAGNRTASGACNCDGVWCAISNCAFSLLLRVGHCLSRGYALRVTLSLPPLVWVTL